MQRRFEAPASAPLDTPRLRLRPPRREDAPAFDALLAEAGEVAGADEGGGAAWVAAEADSLAARGMCRLAVTRREDGALLGYCGFSQPPELRQAAEAELDMRLLRAHRGRGYGREAAGAVLVHGFVTLGLVRVLAVADPGDGPAIRALEAVGLRFAGLEMRPGGGAPAQLYKLDRPA